MKITNGIFLFDNDGLILICHPTCSGRAKNWSIPKGLSEDGEDHFTSLQNI